MNLSESDSYGQHVEYNVVLRPDQKMIEVIQTTDLEKIIAERMNVVNDTASGTKIEWKTKR